MTSCKKCGNNLKRGAVFCPKCGQPCNTDFTKTAYSKEPVKKKKPVSKGRMTFVVISCTVLAFFTVLLLVFALSEPSSTPVEALPVQSVEQSGYSYGQTREFESYSISYMLFGMGYSEAQAKDIEKVLNELGINSIGLYSTTGTPQSGLNSVVCYPNGSFDRDRRFYFTTENGELFYVGFRDYDLYDSENGGVLMSYDEALAKIQN